MLLSWTCNRCGTVNTDEIHLLIMKCEEKKAEECKVEVFGCEECGSKTEVEMNISIFLSGPEPIERLENKWDSRNR